MNPLIEYLAGKGAVHRGEIARALGVSLRTVRLWAEDSRLNSETWHSVVLSTQDGLQLAKEPGQLVDDAARIRAEHLRALQQVKHMERLALDAKQGILPMVVAVILLVPWYLIA